MPDPDAPAVLTIDARGVVLLEIADAKGEAASYRVAPEWFEEPDEWACALARLDGEGSSPHRVSLSLCGRWGCACEDARFRPNRRGRCKHVGAIRPLYYFMHRILQTARLLPMTTKSKSNAPRRPAPAAEPAASAVPAPSGGEAALQAPEASQTVSADLDAVAALLAAPFDAAEVKFKPQTISGNRALAVPFVDARVVMDRLDDVLGVLGWQDRYDVLPDGNVVCTLMVRVGGEWIAKTDVGGESGQPDEGDRRKAAFSDALKRAAVKLGIGRYLYRQKPQWVDYDPQKKQLVRQPVLANVPAAAAKQAATGPRAEALARSEAARQERYGPKAEAPPAAPQSSQPPDRVAWLHGRDGEYAHEGLTKAGDLLEHVRSAVDGAGDGGRDERRWTDEAWKVAAQAVKEFTHALLLDEAARLLDLKGKQVPDAMAFLKVPAATTLAMLDNAQLRGLIGRLRQMDDAPAKGGRKSA